MCTYNYIPLKYGLVLANTEYDYLEDEESDESQKSPDIFWDDVLENEHTESIKMKNCSADITIIDKLLNGTGYNKFRLPSEL